MQATALERSPQHRAWISYVFMDHKLVHVARNARVTRKESRVCNDSEKFLNNFRFANFSPCVRRSVSRRAQAQSSRWQTHTR
jgi:hypothetical protein